MVALAAATGPLDAQVPPSTDQAAPVTTQEQSVAAARAELERLRADPMVRQRLEEDAALISSELNQPGIAVSDWLSTTLKAYSTNSVSARLSRNKSAWSALTSGIAVKSLGTLAASSPPDGGGWSTVGATSDGEIMPKVPAQSAAAAPLRPDVGGKQEQVVTALAANAAAQAVLDGPLPSDPEQLRLVLETIHKVVRPVIVMCGGNPWYTPRSVAYSDKLTRASAALSRLSQATGLIVQYQREADGTLTWLREIGTGVAVPGRRLVTNLHVAEPVIAYRHPLTREWVLPRNRVTRVLFPRQYPRCTPPPSKSSEAIVTEVVAEGSPPQGSTSGADYIVLKLDRDPPATVTFTANDMDGGGEQLVVVGYPTRPDEAEASLTTAQIDRIFGAPDSRVPFVYERISLGERSSPLGDRPGLFTHDASTWHGNSGSGILSLETGAVVGLQVGGMQASGNDQGYNFAVDGRLIAESLARLGP